MAEVVVSEAASQDLDRLVHVLSLPGNTRQRVRRSIELLARFPLLGAALEGRWEPYRFLLGPWRWLIIVYYYDAALDRVGIVSIYDARSAASPLSGV